MQSLFVVYIALSVFGVGVTVLDLFGFLTHPGTGDSDHSGDDGSDGDDGGHDPGDSVGDHDGGSSGHFFEDHHAHDDDASLLTAGPKNEANAVAGALSFLRLLVRASFGAGPTGIFALLSGLSPLSSVFWSLGAGALVAGLSRLVQSFAHRELDSTIHPEELLMDEAVVLIPVQPGQMGKAVVHRYGRAIEVYIRAMDPEIFLPKGSTVRICETDGECFLVDSIGR